MVIFGAVGWADDWIKSVIKTMQVYLHVKSFWTSLASLVQVLHCM
jgi:hypothetical protein